MKNYRTTQITIKIYIECPYCLTKDNKLFNLPINKIHYFTQCIKCNNRLSLKIPEEIKLR